MPHPNTIPPFREGVVVTAVWRCSPDKTKPLDDARRCLCRFSNGKYAICVWSSDTQRWDWLWLQAYLENPERYGWSPQDIPCWGMMSIGNRWENIQTDI